MILILAAFEPELAELRTKLGNKESSKVALEAIGIGAVEAAARSVLVLDKYLNQNFDQSSKAKLKVIFIGSVGSADRSYPLLGPVCGTEAILTDYALAAQLAFLPEPVNARLLADPELIDTCKKKLPSKTIFSPIYSTPSITSTAEAAQILWESTKSPFENLELFSVATACSIYSIPWVSVSVITNYIGPNGHAEWVKNHESAGAYTAQLVMEILGS